MNPDKLKPLLESLVDLIEAHQTAERRVDAGIGLEFAIIRFRGMLFEADLKPLDKKIERIKTDLNGMKVHQPEVYEQMMS